MNRRLFSRTEKRSGFLFAVKRPDARPEIQLDD